MFEQLKPVPQDPILSLLADYRADTHPHKLDLGIGVYKDEQGNTPIMRAVKEAESRLLATEQSKSYTAPAGTAEYNQLASALVFGADHPALRDQRIVSAQTPGGCGALRMGAEFLHGCSQESRVWVSLPTWANHVPLLTGAGLEIAEYPYYDYATKGIQFEAMLQALEQRIIRDPEVSSTSHYHADKPGSILLLGLCCLS